MDDEGHSSWNNTEATHVSFDLKTTNETHAYVQVVTANQTYYLMYSFGYPPGLSFGSYVSIHLDPALKNGAWHTIARDLQADLNSVVPNTPILSVQQFLLGSTNARVDSVMLIK